MRQALHRKSQPGQDNGSVEEEKRPPAILESTGVV